jgi:hypothetical protein
MLRMLSLAKHRIIYFTIILNVVFHFGVRAPEALEKVVLILFGERDLIGLRLVAAPEDRHPHKTIEQL